MIRLFHPGGVAWNFCNRVEFAKEWLNIEAVKVFQWNLLLSDILWATYSLLQATYDSDKFLSKILLLTKITNVMCNRQVSVPHISYPG
jgi:hypothetical protein